MTFPRVYQKGKPKTFDNIDRLATEKYKNRPVPTEQEITAILKKADEIANEYFKLRAKAIIGLVKIFGKRRVELSLLEKSDIAVEQGVLYITFTIVKKSKRGLFQYINFLRKTNSQQLDKPLAQLEAEWREWTKTPEGQRIKRYRRPKGTPLSDKYARLILDYYGYVKNSYPDAKFLFPSGKIVFGSSYLVTNDRSLSGRQILNIVKELDPHVWMHLFRKQKGSEVARKYGRTLESVFMVKDTLDLERQETALHYIEENVPKIETGET